MKTLKQLTKGFAYVNSSIEDNFTLEEPRNSEYKIFKFDKIVTSEEVIEEIKKEGYLPATLSELLTYKGIEDWLIALGSVGKVDGDRYVPYLDGSVSERGLDLRWWGRDWDGNCRFLAVRNLELSPSEPLENELSTSETLTLEQAIEVCKQAGLSVTKTY